MCISCGCDEPLSTHGDSRHITLTDLRSAAEAAGLSVDAAAGNIAKAVAGVGKRVADETDDEALCCVVKASGDERRYTLGVAYPANKADRGRAADGFRDFVSEEVLEKTAWAWMAKHRDVTLYHKEGTSGHATVVESYIYRGPDWELASPVDGENYIVKSGDWLLGTVWDEYGWAAVKSGLVNGWSPEGGARRVQPTPERLAQLRS